MPSRIQLTLRVQFGKIPRGIVPLKKARSPASAGESPIVDAKCWVLDDTLDKGV
jgi:hypothetical protein